MASLSLPVLFDEVNYPLRTIYVTAPGIGRDRDPASVLAGNFVRLEEQLSELNTDKKFRVVNINDRNKICHNTLDMRDSFRIFKNGDRHVALICTTKQVNTEVCKQHCQSSAHTEECRSTLLSRFIELGVPVDDVLQYSYESSFDKLGNLIVSPPTETHPFGVILFGDQSPASLRGLVDADGHLLFQWQPSCGPIDQPLRNQLQNEATRMFSETASMTGFTNTIESRIGRLESYCGSQQSYDFAQVLGRGANGLSITISQRFKHILDNTFCHQPKFNVFTGWLEVGHIDEIISFVKHPEGSQGFKILVASPSKFLELWSSQASANSRDDVCLFSSPLVREGGQTNAILASQRRNKANVGIPKPRASDGCSIRISDFANPRLQSLIQFNEWIQEAILTKIKQQLVDFLHVQESDIIDIPILYIGPDELFNYASELSNAASAAWMSLDRPTTIPAVVSRLREYMENFGVYHLSNNFINSVFSTKYIISSKFMDNIGCMDYIKAQIIRPGGIENIYDVGDDWNTVKYQHGGLHCFTTEFRDFSAARLPTSPCPPVSVGGRFKKSRKQKRKSKKNYRNNKSRRTRNYRK